MGSSVAHRVRSRSARRRTEDWRILSGLGRGGAVCANCSSRLLDCSIRSCPKAKSACRLCTRRSAGAAAAASDTASSVAYPRNEVERPWVIAGQIARMIGSATEVTTAVCRLRDSSWNASRHVIARARSAMRVPREPSAFACPRRVSRSRPVGTCLPASRCASSAARLRQRADVTCRGRLPVASRYWCCPMRKTMTAVNSAPVNVDRESSPIIPVLTPPPRLPTKASVGVANTPKYRSFGIACSRRSKFRMRRHSKSVNNSPPSDEATYSISKPSKAIQAFFSIRRSVEVSHEPRGVGGLIAHAGWACS